MNRKSIILILFLIIFVSCSKDVCTVGVARITDDDIDLRARVSEIYYPGSGKRHVGLAQLIKGYLSLEILKSLGQSIGDATLESEAKRIDENTKAPEVLKKIKEVYGNDRTAYMRTFVQIAYAERALYNEIFLQSKEIHKEQYRTAEDFLKAAVKFPKLFSKTAQEKGFEVTKLRISLQKGIMPYDKTEAHQPPVGIEQAKMFIDKFLKVRQGDIYPEPIEWVEGFQIVKFLKKEGEDSIVESVVIPKKSYDEWFWEKASKIPVRINDKSLKDELLKEVSWAKNLRFE